MAQDRDERAAWEAAEIHGLAELHGARRVYRGDAGIWVWQFPEWVCPFCNGRPVQPGCPDPLANHPPAVKL